ncbi:unnamed protein product [marine sediment metagenome]|uniref:Right handed beta helix domain-containing protein n=1 Tax=marine sediment metagenome TaxID=412755 RepID=X0S7V0_9ZZZZ
MVSLEASLNNPTTDVIVTIISTGGWTDGGGTTSWNFPNSSGIEVFVAPAAGLTSREYYAANPGSTMVSAGQSTQRLRAQYVYNIKITFTDITISPGGSGFSALRAYSSGADITARSCTFMAGGPHLRFDVLGATALVESCGSFRSNGPAVSIANQMTATIRNMDVQGSLGDGISIQGGATLNADNMRVMGSAAADYTVGSGTFNGSYMVTSDGTAPGTNAFPNETESVHFLAVDDSHWGTGNPLDYQTPVDTAWGLDWDHDTRLTGGLNQVGSDFVGPPSGTGVAVLVSAQPLPGSLAGGGGLA